MALRVVVGQPPAQVAVQHDGVEQGLERVVRVQHRVGHQRGRVVEGGQRALRVAELVGLVVDDDIAMLVTARRIRHAQHHVDRATQVSPQELAA